MRQPKCSEVAVYHAHIFCSVKGGTEIILSVPLASKLSAQEQEKHSQILSLSLSSHLGNGNLYLQTVGAGGEHEIFKSTSLHSPPPSLPGLHALSLPTPPLTLFISEMHCKAACQWCIPCFVSLTSQWWDAAELLILHASSSWGVQLCSLFSFFTLTRLLTCGDMRLRNTSFSGSRPSCILKQNTSIYLGPGVGGGALETNSHCSACHNMYWYVVK